MTDMWKNPFTGKMEPRPERRSKVDLVDPKVLPPEVKPMNLYPNEYNTCLAELADIRRKFAALQPGQRQGVTGDKLLKKYRHESLKFTHLSGEKAPPIYEDM